MIFAVVLLGIIGSIVAHEAAHVLAARHLGWAFRGAGVNRRGPYVRVSTTDAARFKRAWAVALAGPLANLELAVVLLEFGDSDVTRTLAYFNIFFAVTNLIPFKGSDGRMILMSLRGKIA